MGVNEPPHFQDTEIKEQLKKPRHLGSTQKPPYYKWFQNGWRKLSFKATTLDLFKEALQQSQGGKGAD